MKKHYYLSVITIFTLITLQSGFAQIEFKLEYMEAEEVWGVFATPDTSINPSSNIIPGSGQVTVVLPNDYQVGEVVSYAGAWTFDARKNHPVENPERDYGSFGWNANFPRMVLEKGKETLLFTF
ncbi:MAG: hypothetical protein KDC24_15205, partial [Saprospiraceae bacterium]|nr:hypothetical protein [Saprospiraceae bacterium]